MMLASVVLNIVFAPLFGYIGDKAPSRVMIPIAFSLRGACGYAFMFQSDPESFSAMAICILLVVFTVLEGICLDVLFFRGMPGNVRGTMLGMFNFFGNIGVLTFTLVGGHIYDHIGRNSPFVFLAGMDTFLVLLALVMLCLGKFK